LASYVTPAQAGVSGGLVRPHAEPFLGCQPSLA